MKIYSEEDKSVLCLDQEYLLYYNGPESQYGEAVAIDVFDDPNYPLSSENRIRDWYKENNIANGEPSIKTRDLKNGDIVAPCYFRVNSWTEIVDLDGNSLDKNELRPGIRIGLVAKAYPYENRQGKQGVTCGLEQIIIYNPQHQKRNYLNDFKKQSIKLKEAREQIDKEMKKQNESLGQAENKEESKIDLSDIPF